MGQHETTAERLRRRFSVLLVNRSGYIPSTDMFHTEILYRDIYKSLGRKKCVYRGRVKFVKVLADLIPFAKIKVLVGAPVVDFVVSFAELAKFQTCRYYVFQIMLVILYYLNDCCPLCR